MKILISFIFALIIPFQLSAQIQASSYFDFGKTTYDDDAFVRTALLGNYRYNKTKVEIGGQFDLKSPRAEGFSAIETEAIQGTDIKNFRLNTHGFFMYNFASDILHESNWGFYFSTQLKHFTFKLGTSFRTYYITDEAQADYEIEMNENLQENWNTVYLLAYYVKPIKNEWNVSLAATNIDHFMVSQETNPMIMLKGNYRISDPWNVYLETWYKRAGSLNISANYLGFFIRTGVIWSVDLKK